MNRIPEFFYPQKLKDLISDLRDEKNINENAQKNLNAIFYTHISIAVLCMFLISLITGYTLILSSSAVIIGIISAYFKLIQKSEKEVLPYSTGEVKKGQIISQNYQKKRAAKYQYTNCDNKNIEQELHFNDSLERLMVPDGPVDVYLHAGNSIPLIEGRFRSSCLNQRRIDALDAKMHFYDLSGY